MTTRPTPQPATPPRVPKIREQHPVTTRATEPEHPEPHTEETTGETRGEPGRTTAGPAGSTQSAQAAQPQQPQLRPLSTRTTEEIHERLRLAAFSQRRSVQEVVTEALDRYLPPLPRA